MKACKNTHCPLAEDPKTLPLVGLIEIARRAGVRRSVVTDWRRRHPAFPEPVETLKVGPVFWWPEVERWLLSTGRSTDKDRRDTWPEELIEKKRDQLRHGMVELPGVRVLSVRQPWTDCLLHHGKPVENRTRKTHYTGLVVIHAGQKWDARGRHLESELGVSVPHDAPRGYLGVMDLTGTHTDTGCCRPWGEPGKEHWQFENPRLFERPIPGPGRLGLYRAMPRTVAAAVKAILAEERAQPATATADASSDSESIQDERTAR